MSKHMIIISLLLAAILLCPTFMAFAETDAEVTEGVITCFEQLAAIPRPSHHEEKISAFLLSWARERGFDARQDGAGNVIFDVPATAGRESAPLVALQAHMDMVVASVDPNFDALNAPIKTVRGDNTLTADGTSLGADDGIGVATIMYLVDSKLAHGPLRVIFTVNEEDGMSGISNLDASEVGDVAYLINLDSETVGEAVVSTAAGMILAATQVPLRALPALDTALTIAIGGLKGGHSGVMIGEGRINAVQSMADLLLCMRRAGVACELSSFVGGTAGNAIPNSAEALIVVAAEDAARAEAIAVEWAKALASAYAASDAGLTVTVAAADMPETVFEAEQAANIVDFAALALDGLHTMSQSVEGLVESSSNMGLFRADADGVTAMLNSRSSQEALLDSICLKQGRLAELCGYEATFTRAAHAWPARTDSALHALMKEIYLEQNGEELKLMYMHAGLECGAFARMKEGLEMIAIGPELRDVHTVNETLYLDSIIPFYRLLEETLARLSELT